MIDYDFSTLNDKEFENLTIDLISRDKGKRFERFKAGRDGGIDGRYYCDDGKEEIIQCKHYLKTGYKGLIRELKKKNNGKNEVDKVKKLNPKKYIFVTSLRLSPDNKKVIKKLFEPYIKNDNDIYGQEDLNNLLKANSDIEEIHYKLWISSTTVLKRIFNNAIKGRSDFLLDEIKDKIKYYVITENHNKAIKKLEESHTIIIAGEPGIGKTTLAEHIALHYIEKGFEFCVITKDISEAEAIFEKDKKQIFYFDDFLGSNYLNALESHTDSQIMQFITRVKRNKDKRFILTSRTIILNQGVLLSDKFRTKKLDSDEFIIKVEDLKDIDKAKILYNHIWHSNLSEEYIDELYEDKRYRLIINHKNFNPRLIEFITDIDRIRSNSATNYWEDIQYNLDNPSEIWANTFDRQSDEYIRNIVSLVVFNGNSIEEEEELRKAYYRLNDMTGLKNNSHNSKEFDSVIRETVKYFLNKKLKDNTAIYSLFNPSIADFVLKRSQTEQIKLYLLSLGTIASLKTLKNLEISKNEYQKILKEMMQQNEFFINEDYFVNLLYLLYEEDLIDNFNEENLKIFNNFLHNNTLPSISSDSFYKFFEILIYYIQKKYINISNVSAIVDFICNSDIYDLNLLASFIKLLNLFPKEPNCKNDLIRELEEYLKDYLSQESYNINFSLVDHYIDDYDDIIYDEDEILRQLTILLEEIINDEIDADISYLINKDSIIQDMDIGDIINNYEVREAKSYNYEYYEDNFFDIDDLFQRG